MSFSRGERNGILILCVILFLFWVLWYLIPLLVKSPASDFSHFDAEVTRFMRQVDSSDSEKARGPALFYFDPNTLDAEGWLKLGMSNRQVHTIENYRKAGGRFRGPEDLQKIYGLSKHRADQLMPWVRIVPLHEKDSSTASVPQRNIRPFSGSLSSPKEQYLVDLNKADTFELIKLKGIGSVLAQRIIRYRERLGGFVRTDQLGEVYGIPVDILESVKSQVTCDSSLIRFIPVNSADEMTLCGHPYLSRWEARAIITYRRLKGPVKKLDDLLEQKVLNDNTYRRIKPYLSLL